MSFMQVGQWQVHDTSGHRKYLTADETRRFLLQADRLAADLRALCYVLAYSGCRVSEALDLSDHRLDPERGVLTLRTLKRRHVRFRTVPIPPALMDLLLALPPAPDGKFWRMHRTTAWRHVRRTMALAGITGPMGSPKGLRHGLGLRAAACGVPPSLIAKWLGHASLTTTAIYLDAVGLEERAFAERMWSAGHTSENSHNCNKTSHPERI